MKTKIVACLLGLTFLLSVTGKAGAQTSYAPPEKDSKFVLEYGVGLGGYFGTFGAKCSASSNLLGVDLGVGLGPLAKKFTVDISPGISLYLKGRYAALRPKVSLLFSSIGYTLNVMEKMDGGKSNVLYQKSFPSAGILLGVDWRLGKKGRVCINIDLGYLYPFKGYNEVKRIKEEQVAEWRLKGYEIEDRFGMDTVTAADYIDFSLGVSIAVGRSLVAK